MVDGQLEIIWSQLHYATRTLSPVRLVLKVTLFMLLHCTGVFLCFWGCFLEVGIPKIPSPEKTDDRRQARRRRQALFGSGPEGPE